MASDIIIGAVLAGGRSRRMGRDKALLEYRGKTFLQIAAEALREVVDKVIVIADDAQTWTLPGLSAYPDIFKNCGPLGGIHSALTHAAAEGVMIVSCDLPLLGPRLLRSILADASGDVNVPRAAGRIQPLCGLYRRPFLPVAAEYLGSGEYRMLRVLGDPRVRLRIVDAAADSRELMNVNTPDDYRQLLEPHRFDVSGAPTP